MRIYVMRQTGFYAQASPIKVTVNDQSFSLNHQQEKGLTISGNSIEIAASFFWLKSQPVSFSNLEDGARFVIKMQPRMLLIYGLLFATMLLVPVILVMPWLILLLIVAYGVFLVNFLKQAYVIERLPSV